MVALVIVIAVSDCTFVPPVGAVNLRDPTWMVPPASIWMDAIFEDERCGSACARAISCAAQTERAQSKEQRKPIGMHDEISRTPTSFSREVGVKASHSHG